MAWAYQKGSARLGVVDLFSCEIATICRITKIARAAQRYVYLYGISDQALRVRAQEHYTPIFDGNSKELQALDARVIEPVTEFYTYQKALLDYLRNLENWSGRKIRSGLAGRDVQGHIHVFPYARERSQGGW